MILHMLPGDAVANGFGNVGLEGDVAVCRECLVDGPVEAEGLHDLWTLRREYLNSRYPNSGVSYASEVAAELGKLIELPSGSTVNLWFEYELFCQVNLWFCLYLLRDTTAAVYRVGPVIDGDRGSLWKGFGGLGPAELKACFLQRTKLRPEDIKAGGELWLAFQAGDGERLLEISGSASQEKFPHLKEVVGAALERERRPAEVLRAITASGITDFHEIFKRFSEAAGVYGYGDEQVKALLSTL